MSTTHDAGSIHRCAGAVDRRAFIRRAAIAAGAVLAGLGATTPALADELGEISADGTTPSAHLFRYQMPATDGAVVDAVNEVLLVRWAGRVYAFALACPHRGTRLQWQGTTDGVYCPKHKARFQPDGTNVGGRRTPDLDRHPIRLEGSQLVVDLATRLRAEADGAAWAAAYVMATPA